MKRLAIFLMCAAIILLTTTSSGVSSPNIIGKWELVRLEYADGKIKPHDASKPKMGGAEFFNDKTVLFSDGLKGEWTISGDGSLKIILMGVLEMFGSIKGDILKLHTMVDPNEILVLRKGK